MADFLTVVGVMAFAASMLGLIWALDTRMTSIQALLLVMSIALFLYLGFAMFRAEQF